MPIAILTFEGFNEIDSFVAATMLNFGCMGLGRPELRAMIVCPSERVASMNGVVVQTQAPMSFLREADAVIIGSGMHTRDVVKTPSLMEELKLDPSRQIIGSQCSGALVLAKLGLLAGVPACTDSTSKAWVQDAGVEVLDQPFFARGNVATAGGCLSSHYLAAWVIARLSGWQVAEGIVHYVAPVGQKKEYSERAHAVLAPYLPEHLSVEV